MIKLNLGSKNRKLNEFDNLDQLFGWQFQEGLPKYQDNSVDGITISHALMFLTLPELNKFAHEMWRVLKIGGVVRITEDDTENPKSKTYQTGNVKSEPKCLTGPKMMRILLEDAGFSAYDVNQSKTHFVDSSLIQSYRGGEPNVFFIEGIKGSPPPKGLKSRSSSVIDNRWLLKYKKNVHSQRGEDGVLAKIFEILKIEHGWCVDVGAYGKNLSNTYALIATGWSGVLIEENQERLLTLERYHSYSHRKVYCICAHVEPLGDKSLDVLLKETPLPKDFEFLSIDIDGNDYYIWESLKNYSPTVVIIEFNSYVKLAPFLQPIDGYGGASLTTIVDLGKLKGYELIATTSFNAIFVKKNLFEKFKISDNSPQELWEPDPHDFKNPSMPIKI